MGREQLIDALMDELDLVRGASRDPFEDIATVVSSWVSRGLSRKGLSEHMGMPPEQLIPIVDLSPSRPIDGRTATWAKCAASLLFEHPSLKPDSRGAYLKEIEEGPRAAASEGLRRVKELARRIRPNQGQHSEEALDRLMRWAPPSRTPRRYREGTFSKERFAEGLRDSLRRLDAELQFLTIAQVSALETSFRERRLWVQGPAGSGKTLLAIEVAYRALRAGLSTVFVYRSTQMRQVLTSLLQDLPGELYLLPHFDFVHFLHEFNAFGHGEDLYEIVDSFLPGIGAEAVGPLVDQIVVDDCGTFSATLPPLLQFVEKIAHRVMILAAPDQICPEISISGAASDADRSAISVKVVNQDLVCPSDYHSVSLPRNLRNARAVVAYARPFANEEFEGVVQEPGDAREFRTTWDRFDESLYDLVGELLRAFPPQKIRVLTDPLLGEVESPSGELGSIARAVLDLKHSSFFFSAMDDEAERELRGLVALHSGPKVRFVCTDGETVHFIDGAEVKSLFPSPMPELNAASWPTPRVDATGILHRDVLEDPSLLANAILVAPSPLAIGLECEAVVYVRPDPDPLSEEISGDSRLEAAYRRGRKLHHFAAFSRARVRLVDLVVT